MYSVRGSVALLLTVSAAVVVHSAASDRSETKCTSKSAHMDHNPKHGGTFFMALNQRHHLEGVLLPAARFRVYLYDSHTRPVDPVELRRAKGIVQWGEAEDAPLVPLTVAGNGQYLEAVWEGDLRLPIVLTLRLSLPGGSPDTNPELFTFPMSRYNSE
jgi:hypothetical protein